MPHHSTFCKAKHRPDKRLWDRNRNYERTLEKKIEELSGSLKKEREGKLINAFARHRLLKKWSAAKIARVLRQKKVENGLKRCGKSGVMTEELQKQMVEMGVMLHSVTICSVNMHLPNRTKAGAPKRRGEEALPTTH